MPTFNFRQFHLRSIHADASEKAAINQELKDLYASLSEEDKVIFNAELQQFLMQQYKTIGDDYQALKQGGAI
ncbi:MAG: hypothetical protein U0Y10_00605 [Spirosomataceae bacterium]